MSVDSTTMVLGSAGAPEPSARASVATKIPLFPGRCSAAAHRAISVSTFSPGTRRTNRAVVIAEPPSALRAFRTAISGQSALGRKNTG